MENLQTVWFELLAGALAGSGVRDVVVSPGSRSTPLVLALAGEPGLRLHDAIDERAAAFYALGQARVTGRPSVCLCTSGTAGAHYLPAVIEASETHVPMILLTADRPSELHGCGANQTVDQLGFFAAYARRVVDLGQAEGSALALRALRRIVVQAVVAAADGPVHLNARARKPLEPRAATSEAGLALAALAAQLKAEPLTRFMPAGSAPDVATIGELAALCRRARRGLVVAGPAPLAQQADRDTVRRFCAATGFVLAADATSQLRQGANLATLDWLFSTTRHARELLPDLVIQLGAAPTSSAWERFVASHPEVPRVVLAPHGWPDPTSSARHVVAGPIGANLAALGEALGTGGEPSAYAAACQAAERTVWRTIDRDLAATSVLEEAAVVREVVASLPAGGLLAVGNSLSVRHLDNYVAGDLDAGVISQRGVSGIDGLIAGAAGAASVSDQPLTLLLGDVSFLHDVGGLALARKLVIVVVDNDGGRIFEQLPLARAGHAGALAHFTTPHGLDLAHAAALYGHAYRRCEDRASLAAALTEAHEGTTVIHAVCPPHGAAAQWTRILEAIA